MTQKQIPKDWQEVELGEIFVFENKSGRKAGEGNGQGKYKFFTSSNIQSKFIDNYDFDEDHLIFSTGGQAGIHYCNEKFSSSNDCFVIKVDNRILTKYVYYYLLYKIYLLEEGFKGAGLKHISKSYIQQIKIIYPESKDIQKQIVSILEKAEKLKQKREEADKLTKEYLKSIFYEIFLKKKNNVSLKKGGELFELVYGKGLSESERDGGKYPVYGSNGVVGNHSKFLVNGPGIIIGRKGSIGEVNYSKNNFWPIDTTYYVKPLKKMDFTYLYYLLRSYNLKLNSSTAIPGLNRNEVYAISFIDSSLSLQQKFTKIVEQVEKLKEKQQKSKEEINNLFNSLMQKAFNGELVK